MSRKFVLYGNINKFASFCVLTTRGFFPHRGFFTNRGSARVTPYPYPCGLRCVRVRVRCAIFHSRVNPCSTLVLIRPWHPNLLQSAINTDDASTHQWLTRLEQPFSALLLMELPHNEYRRVASFCQIIACPTDSAGALKGEVNTVTIV